MSKKNPPIQIGAQYAWGRDGGFGVPAAVFGSELERLYEERGGAEAADLVEIARPDSAPLHPAFEWDDSIAAERWRENQARNMLGSIRVRYIDGGSEVPAFMPVSVVRQDATGGESGQTDSRFLPQRNIASDPSYRLEVIKRELARIEGYIERTEWIDEFEPFRLALEEVVTRVMALSKAQRKAA